MITKENYEEYIMMYADGELKPSEEVALMAYIDKRPELKNELDAYKSLRFIPDTTSVFTDKRSLLKQGPVKQIIRFPAVRKYGIAAGIAALVFIALFKYFRPGKTNEVVTKTEEVKSQLPEPKNEIAVKPDNKTEQQNIAAMPVNRKSTTKHPIAITPVIVAATAAINKQPGANIPVLQTDRPCGHKLTYDTLHIAQVSGTKVITSSSIVIETPPKTVVPETIISSGGAGIKRSFLDKLPIDDLKKEGMENVATAIANTCEQVNVKVEKRKLIISF